MEFSTEIYALHVVVIAFALGWLLGAVLHR
jgi:hypothetical protein